MSFIWPRALCKSRGLSKHRPLDQAFAQGGGVLRAGSSLETRTPRQARLPRGCQSSPGPAINSKGTAEAVRQAVGGGCQSGWRRLLSVTNAVEHWPSGRQWLGVGWAPWGGRGTPLPMHPVLPWAAALSRIQSHILVSSSRTQRCSPGEGLAAASPPNVQERPAPDRPRFSSTLPVQGQGGRAQPLRHRRPNLGTSGGRGRQGYLGVAPGPPHADLVGDGVYAMPLSRPGGGGVQVLFFGIFLCISRRRSFSASFAFFFWAFLNFFASVLPSVSFYIVAIHGQVCVTCTILTGGGVAHALICIFFASHLLQSQLASPPPLTRRGHSVDRYGPLIPLTRRWFGHFWHLLGEVGGSASVLEGGMRVQPSTKGPRRFDRRPRLVVACLSELPVLLTDLEMPCKTVAS